MTALSVKEPNTKAGSVQLQPLLLNDEQAAVVCSVSRTSWWRMVSSGAAPQPVYPTENSARWRFADVQKFVAELPAGKRRLKVTRVEESE